MENVVIVGFARTPVGGYGGSLKDIPVYRLGSLVLKEAAKRANIEPHMVEDVIMGTAWRRFLPC